MKMQRISSKDLKLKNAIKTPHDFSITIKVEKSVADRIMTMKHRLQQNGEYFSVTKVCESAIQNALDDVEKGLSDSTDLEMTHALNRL